MLLHGMQKQHAVPLPQADVALECASPQAAGAPLRTARCLRSGRGLCPDFEIKWEVKGKINTSACLSPQMRRAATVLLGWVSWFCCGPLISIIA